MEHRPTASDPGKGQIKAGFGSCMSGVEKAANLTWPHDDFGPAQSAPFYYKFEVIFKEKYRGCYLHTRTHSLIGSAAYCY